jgi:hypothetical protein
MQAQCASAREGRLFAKTKLESAASNPSSSASGLCLERMRPPFAATAFNIQFNASKTNPPGNNTAAMGKAHRRVNVRILFFAPIGRY